MNRTKSLLAAGLLIASAVVVLPVTASGSTAGTAGTAGVDGSCARRETLFCEDFESLPGGGPSTLAWGIDTRHGTLRVERLHAARGGKALHVHTERNGMAFLKVYDFSAPGNSFYGRIRLNVDAFPSAPDWAHFTLIEVTGSGSTEIVRPLGGQFAPTVGPGKTFWGVGADGGPTGDWTNWRESAPTVTDRWLCVEYLWYSPENRISIWIDGVAQPDLTVTTTDHGGAATDFILPRAETIKIGWQLYHGNPTPGHFDLWLDDIAIAASRLGC